MTSIALNKKKNFAGIIGRGGRFLKAWGMFFRQFVKHPGMIGSVIPSSPVLVDSMLEGVDWSRTRLFVEYGPGVGTFTREILDRMHPDATLLAIDVNLDFIDFLNREISDPRLRAIHGSAADVRRYMLEAGHKHADYVLSGLPFSTLPDGVGDDICKQTQGVLGEGGTFLVYQYSGFVRRLLTPQFDHIEEHLEWLNIPPCRLFRATKTDKALAQAA